MARKLIVIFFLFSTVINAQKGWDTTYYVKYKSRLIIGVFHSYRQYEVNMTQRITKDTTGRSKIGYAADANQITGIDLSYDKINLSFGIKSVPPPNAAKTGNTTHFNIGLNVGGNKWLAEAAYRRYAGFYDKGSSNYDTNFRATGIYDQFPKLSSSLYKAKFIYFINNKRFAFKSGYSSTCRQLKSSATFILAASGYHNILMSDSSIIPAQIRYYYDTHFDFRGLDVYGFAMYGGASANIVLWRALFLNLTLLFGPEEQWRTYHYSAESRYNRTLFYQSLSGDFRIAWGFNFNRWYANVNFTSDFAYYNAGEMQMKSRYLSTSFSIGYRFKVKTPKFYQRLQATKLYQKL